MKNSVEIELGNLQNRFVRVSKRRGIFSINDFQITDHQTSFVTAICIWENTAILQDEGQRLMRAVMAKLNLSARVYHHARSVKLARTIADLARSEMIQSVHLAEALQYRPNLMMG